MTIVEITGGMLRAVAQYVSAYDARGDSEMLSTDFCRGVIPATSWRVVYKSFSASSRNSSGTDREGPNTTDPYPTASHPKRSRIMSTARSAPPSLSWCRAGAFHLQAPAEVPTALSSAPQDATRRSPAAIRSSHQDDRQAPYERAPRRFRQG